MIYVRIELWPGGDCERAELLQEVQIANQGTGDTVHGDYRVQVSHSTKYKPAFKAPFKGWENPALPINAQVWKRGYLLGWRRDRSPAELVHAALSRIFERPAGGQGGR